MEPPPASATHKFIEIQLKQWGYEKYIPMFKGMGPEKFLALGFMDIRELLPGDEIAQADIFLKIKGLADLHIVDEVINGEFQLINDVRIKDENEMMEVDGPGGTGTRRIKVEPQEDENDIEILEVHNGHGSGPSTSSGTITIKDEPGSDEVELIKVIGPAFAHNSGLTGIGKIKEESEDIELIEEVENPKVPAIDSNTITLEKHPGVKINVQLLPAAARQENVPESIPRPQPEPGTSNNDKEPNTPTTKQSTQHKPTASFSSSIPQPNRKKETAKMKQIRQFWQDKTVQNRTGGTPGTGRGTQGGLGRGNGKSLGRPRKMKEQTQIKSQKRRTDPGPHLNSSFLDLGTKRARDDEFGCSKRAVMMDSVVHTGEKLLNLDVKTRRVPKMLKDLSFLRTYKGTQRILTCNFEFDNVFMMNKILDGLRTEPKLQDVNRLGLNSKKELVIGQEQMMKLLDLPQLKTMTSLGLNVGLSPDLLPFVELLLTQATYLQIFNVKHGFMGMGTPGPDTEQLVLTVPKMSEINEFYWAADYGVSSVVQKKATLIELDDEDGDGDKNQSSSKIGKVTPIPVLIDFTDILLKKLQVLELGVTVGVKMMNMNQFPNMVSFNIESFWDPILVFPEGSPTNSITEIQFPVGISNPKLIELVIKNCPLLVLIWIYLPSIECLRTLIRLINGSPVTHLYIQINYDFASALLSVFMDLPYVARTLADKQKLMKLKEYKHWENFARHFKIEVPKEQEDVNDKTLRGNKRYGIGGVTHLKAIHLEFEPRVIFMPYGDKLWSDLDFELSDERFSFIEEFPFSSQVLLEEFTKLKEMDKFLYYNFMIAPSDWQTFESEMEFAPVQIPWSFHSDVVDQKDSLTHQISVKDEKY